MFLKCIASSGNTNWVGSLFSVLIVMTSGCVIASALHLQLCCALGVNDCPDLPHTKQLGKGM